MPTLGDEADSILVKGLNIGASGGGKTGALACLAKAGYRLIIYDFDIGTQILMDPAVLPPEFRKNVIVRRYVDKVKATPAGPHFIDPPMAWMNFLRELDTNPETGKLEKLTDRDVVVVDSLTFAGNSLLRWHQSLAGTLNKQPPWKEFGPAMGAQENLLAILYSNACPCNVIINAHVTYIGGNDAAGDTMTALLDIAKDQKKDGEVDDGVASAIALVAGSVRPDQGYASALGNKLPPKVGRYFNTVVRTKSIGQGATERRVMVTRSEDSIELKVPMPSKIPQTMPVDTGWLTIFKAVRGE